MTWRDRATCLGEDPELFFPIGNTGPSLVQIEEAKTICGRCEVVDTCLRWAIESGADTGVWGGLSDDERRSFNRRRARALVVSLVVEARATTGSVPAPSDDRRSRLNGAGKGRLTGRPGSFLVARGTTQTAGSTVSGRGPRQVSNPGLH